MGHHRSGPVYQRKVVYPSGIPLCPTGRPRAQGGTLRAHTQGEIGLPGRSQGAQALVCKTMALLEEAWLFCFLFFFAFFAAILRCCLVAKMTMSRPRVPEGAALGQPGVLTVTDVGGEQRPR